MVPMSSGFMQLNLPTHFTILLYYSDKKKYQLNLPSHKSKESNETDTFSKMVNQKILKINASKVFQSTYQSISINAK